MLNDLEVKCSLKVASKPFPEDKLRASRRACHPHSAGEGVTSTAPGGGCRIFNLRGMAADPGRSCQTRKIITSVAFMRAAAVCPALSCISRAELAVIIDVICWSPIEIFTSAIRPLVRTLSILPTS